MTSKFLPCLHNSTNLVATVLTLIDDLQFRRPWQPQKTARPRIPGDAGGVFRSPVYAFYRSAWSGAVPGERRRLHFHRSATGSDPKLLEYDRAGLRPGFGSRPPNLFW